MARTTGYTASAVIDILDQNIFIEKGAFSPELVGSNLKVINYLLNHLKERHVTVKKIN